MRKLESVAVLKILGFKRALVASMIVLIMGALIIANFLSYRKIRQSTIDEVNQTSKMVVEDEANKIERWFHSKANVVKGLAQSYQQGVFHQDFVAITRTAKATSDVSGGF